MDVKTVDANAVFRAGFTRCKDDTQTLILDIRNKKEFAKQHVALAYNIRLTAKGDTLLVCRAHTPPPPSYDAPPHSPLLHWTRLPALQSQAGVSALVQIALWLSQDYSKNTYDQAWSQDCWCASLSAPRRTSANHVAISTAVNVHGTVRTRPADD